MNVLPLARHGPGSASLLAVACALSIAACGVETIESVRRHPAAGPRAPVAFAPGVTEYGVPAASSVDFSRSPQISILDSTY